MRSISFNTSTHHTILTKRSINATTRRLSIRRIADSSPTRHTRKTSSANTLTKNYNSKTITEPLKINRLGEHTTENAAQKLNRTHVYRLKVHSTEPHQQLPQPSYSKKFRLIVHSWPPWHGGKQDSPSLNQRQLHDLTVTVDHQFSRHKRSQTVSRGAPLLPPTKEYDKAPLQNKLIGRRIQKLPLCGQDISHSVFRPSFSFVLRNVR